MVLMISNMLFLSFGRSFDIQVNSNGPWNEISNNIVCGTSKGSDQPAHRRRLIKAFAGRLNIL